MEITEIHFDSIDSTNAYAMREYALFSPDQITCISAEVQTAGHGRRQRVWVSPRGVNLYITFCFRLASNTSGLASLSIVGAYVLASLLQKEGLDPKIKWPNDVQLNGKKVAGILSEILFVEKWVQIALGIGLNVNMEKADLDQIDKPATSLKVETEKSWDREALMRTLKAHFAFQITQFKKEGFAPFRDAIEDLLAYKGQRIHCFDGKNEWTGICHSLGKDGQLNLLLPDGTLHALYSGDVSKGLSGNKF